MGRSRPAGRCHAHRASRSFRHRRRRTDACVPLGYRPEEALLVQLGEDAAPLLVDRRIGGQTEQRYCRALRLGDARQDVRGASSARTFADTDPPADPGIDVGHEGRRSLIPRHDVLDVTSSVAKSVVKRHSSVAGKPKDMINAGLGKNIDERSRSLHRQLPLPLASPRRLLARTAMYTSLTFVPVGPVSTAPPDATKTLWLSFRASAHVGSTPLSRARWAVSASAVAPARPVIASCPSVPRLAITQSNRPRCSNSSAAASENSVFRPTRPSPFTVTVASPPPRTTSTDSGSSATSETNARPISAASPCVAFQTIRHSSPSSVALLAAA